MNELQAQSSLQDYLDEKEQIEQDRFKVDTDEKANWSLRKIKQFQDQKEANNKLAVDEIEKIEAWNKSENEKAQQSIDYFQGLLAYYAQSKRDQDPKFKKLELPNGKIKFTKQQPKYNYNDDLLLDYLKKAERSDLIKVKESPDKATVKKLFTIQGDQLIDTETGEFVEGVSIEHRNDAFKVEVSE
jgi:hypothetical protein